MTTIAQTLTTALQHHQAGRLAAAEEGYRRVLQIEPTQVDALHLLGLVAHQSGRHEMAVEYIRRAIGLKADEALFHNNLGGVYRALRRPAEAASCYRRALELQPNFAEAYNNLGVAVKEQGMLDEAGACYRRALALRPDYAEALSNLAVILTEQGNLDEAVACGRRALVAQPELVEAHLNLGNALKGQSRLDEAVACYRRGLELRPDSVEGLSNLGNVLKSQGHLDEAESCYRRALERSPDYADAHNNLGTVFVAQGRFDDAVACYRRAVALKPDDARAHNNLGAAFADLGQLDEAAACYRRALELNPDYAEAYNNLGTGLKNQGKLDEALACFRRSLALKPHFFEAHSNLLYAMLFSPTQDPSQVFEEHRRWQREQAEPLARWIEPHDNDRSPDRRLRVGYVSPDFRNHVIGRNLLPLLREHDHQQFEILCYAAVPHYDELTERFQGYADVWCRTTGLTDEQLAQRIRQDRVDILIDTTLHLARNRLLAFARRPAPVQVTFAGYPGTTGLTAMDYRLTDPHLDPPGAFDQYYSEESVRLPDAFWCYDPADREPAVNGLPAAAKGHVTFGCLNNFCKVNPLVLKLWAGVLQAVEGSRLTVLSGEGGHRRDTLDRLAAEGVAGDRVTFVASRPRPEYLRYYHGIDVGLDTVPYNGHSTSLDAFWMGVPVVTLAGATVVGRAGVCQLMNLGLPELIASTAEQYVQIAAGLANDRPRLSRLRATLRDRMLSSPLTDAMRFTRNIEAAYRAMWRRWCAR